MPYTMLIIEPRGQRAEGRGTEQQRHGRPAAPCGRDQRQEQQLAQVAAQPAGQGQGQRDGQQRHAVQADAHEQTVEQPLAAAGDAVDGAQQGQQRRRRDQRQQGRPGRGRERQRHVQELGHAGSPGGAMPGTLASGAAWRCLI